MKYRAEIDGLRALAVVPVIFYHAGFELFSGGFVGVDVFFVISGYLITTILIEGIENNRFSIVNFYVRRARRILPALFFVMLACIPFAWMWMLPSQMKEFSQTLVAVSVFSSNVLFWRTNDYFNPVAEENPLLHTWSLAVEEQYYLLFPVFLSLSWRLGKKRVFWMIVVFAAFSLLLSEWGWRNRAIANFYLAPTRAWELLAGSIAAFIAQKRGVQCNDPFSLLGLAAILFAIFAYDETTPFPSVYALVPVLGVVLLVLFAGKETFVAKILSTKAFVGLGLISYSAYLWHQPLFAFAKIRLMEEPSSLLMLGLSAVSICLAAVSWKYVEAPFRAKTSVLSSRRVIFPASAIGMSIFVFIGLLGHQENGFLERMPPVVNAIELAGAPVKVSCFTEEFNDCRLGDSEKKVEFVLIGDSHAGRYAYGFEKQSRQDDFSFRVVVGGWCAPLINWDVLGGKKPNKDCFPSMGNAILDIASDGNIETVVLAAEWANYTQGYRCGDRTTTYVYDGVVTSKPTETSQAFFSALNDTVQLLISSGKRVIIIEPIPEYKVSVPEALAKGALHNEDINILKIPLGEYYRRNKEVFDSFDKLDQEGLIRLPVHKFFCNSDECTPYSQSELPLYNDSNHLSELGLELLQEEFLEKIMDRSFPSKRP